MGKCTKGPWQLHPVDDTIIIDGNERVVASVCAGDEEDGWYDYNNPTDWPFMEANAALIAEAGTVAHETGLTPRQLADQRAELLAALKHTARVLADWHKTDFNEIVADGGVTASDVIRQECGWHSARLLKAITNAERKP